MSTKINSLLADKKHDIDIRSECLIFGYCRYLERAIESRAKQWSIFKNVPVYIYGLVVAYFFMPERFEVPGRGCTISEDGLSVTKKRFGTGYNSTSYGRVSIRSEDAVRCTWVLRLDKLCRNRVSIGISSNDAPDGDFAVTDCTHYHYSYNSFVGYKICHDNMTSYGEKFTQGDSISIHLDLVKKHVTFDKNEKSQGIAFDDVKTGPDISYRLSIALRDENDVISISKFVHKDVRD